MRLKKAYLFLIEATNDIEIFSSVAYFGPEKQTDSSKSLKSYATAAKKCRKSEKLILMSRSKHIFRRFRKFGKPKYGKRMSISSAFKL